MKQHAIEQSKISRFISSMILPSNGYITRNKLTE